MTDYVLSPDPRLLEKAIPVDMNDLELVASVAGQLAAALDDTPHAVAVAANQIGLQARAFAYRLPVGPEASPGDLVRVLFNPHIVRVRGQERSGWEGCLSFPTTEFRVPRFTNIVVGADLGSGEPTHVHTNGFQARVFQHEIDHLDGITVDTRAHAQREIKR